MFTAKNINGEKISIDDIETGEDYFCPACNEKLLIKALESTGIRTYFSHKPKSKCIDSWRKDYDMSEWHYEWQNKFPAENQEVYMCANNEIHRADVCIYNTVIEFQHSYISRENFIKRNVFYTSCGYNVIWVFDFTSKVKIEDLTFSGYNYFRRVQNTFANFDNLGDKIKVFFEVEIQPEQKQELDRLIPNISKYDRILFWTMKLNDYHWQTYRFYRPITQNNFLKEFGIISDDTELSVSDICKNTKLKLEEEQREREKIGRQQVYSIWNRPRPTRKFRL